MIIATTGIERTAFEALYSKYILFQIRRSEAEMYEYHASFQSQKYVRFEKKKKKLLHSLSIGLHQSRPQLKRRLQNHFWYL